MNIKISLSLAILLPSVAFSQNTFTNTGTNVGIGTQTPTQRLEIVTNGASNIQLTNNWDVLEPIGAIKFNMAGTEVSSIEAERTIAAGRLTALKFFTRGGSGVTAEAMRITHDWHVGIGTTTPIARLHVAGPQTTALAKFTVNTIPATDAYLSIENATLTTGAYIPSIKGKSNLTGRPFGIFITGEAEDVAPSASDAFGGAIVLDGRSKTGTKLTNNNIVMINSAGQNLVAFKADGSVGIGATDTKGYKLAVNGSAIFTKVKVMSYGAWPDYVFETPYVLMPLDSLEGYVKENKHLPEITPAAIVEKEGLDLGEINKTLTKKLEEVTLYLFELNKRNKVLEGRLQQIESQSRSGKDKRKLAMKRH